MTEEELNLNLEPLRTFLEKETTMTDLLEHLHNIYYRFTELAFRASNGENEPVYENAIIARYWLERLITLFEKMRIKP